MRLSQLILFLTLIIAISICQNENKQNNKKVVCYYTNWSSYRKGNAKFTPSSINPFICTHLIYAFATFSKDLGLASSDPNQDIDNNGFRDFTFLKSINPNLTTQLSIGGWVEASARFSRIAGSTDRRDYFTQSAIKLLREYDFDGLNIDWQYPGFRDGSTPEDKENYVKLVKAIREGFDKEGIETNRTRLIVTMSVPAEMEYNDQGYDLLELQKYTDFFNILAYDYHLSYEPNVGHHAPLYPLLSEIKANINMHLNGDATVQFLLNKGMMKEKLNLGIPTFGRTYKLENKNDNKLGAPSKGLGVGAGDSKEQGYRTYFQICKSIRFENWTAVSVNKTALGPYAFKDDDWVGFDDEDMVRTKGMYVREKGLGGIMFWTIDDDDYRGECGGRTFPLIKAGREGVLNLTRELDKDVVNMVQKEDAS